MELSQLRYFQALAKNEHLTQTAEQLYISPPSLSASISRLEKELGVRLFDRIGRRIYLNARGEAFFNSINSVLSSLDQAVSEVSTMEKRKDATLYIASTSPNVFQRVFQSFLKDHPAIKLSHIALKLDRLPDIDLLNEYDYLLASPQDFSPHPSIESKVLYNNDYAVLMLYPDHPLAGAKEACLRLVKDEPFVALSPGYSSRRFFDETCASAGFTPNIVMECDYTIRAYMVMQRTGIAIATAHSKLLNNCGDTVVVRINPPLTNRIQSIYWDKRRYRSQIAQTFFAYICGYFKDYSFDI